MLVLNTPADAIQLLASLGAHAWLVQHHKLVVEAAMELCAGLNATFDKRAVLVGAALHDAGKIEVPGEMSAPGHAHEQAGRRLLELNGVPPGLARFCVTHAQWAEVDVMLEDLLVAAADKLWKGQRNEELEAKLVSVVCAQTGRQSWEVFGELDAVFERVADGGADRLSRSRV
jgi:hypothetical protein